MTRHHRPALIALAVAIASLLAGCVAAPATEYEAVEVRTESRLDADELSVRADGHERTIREATLRVRTRTCFGVGSGSGIAIRDDLLVTNRHVVAGADVVQITTWNGRSFDVEVSAIAVEDDLAIVQVAGQLPETLPTHRAPVAGDRVTAVGYPGGGELTFSHGRVVDHVDGELFEQQAPSIRITANIRQGNSGGPLLDEEGRIVGIVFAVETATNYGLAVPIDAFERAASSQRFLANPSPC